MKKYLLGGLLLSSFWDILAGAQKGGSGTCSPKSKCVTGCCSTNGYCGFGPDFCGHGKCVSSCDAVAECGRTYYISPRNKYSIGLVLTQHRICGSREHNLPFERLLLKIWVRNALILFR